MLYAPNLVDLDLSIVHIHLGSNNITSIRSLRKCGFRLDHLFLSTFPVSRQQPFDGVSWTQRNTFPQASKERIRHKVSLS